MRVNIPHIFTLALKWRGGSSKMCYKSMFLKVFLRFISKETSCEVPSKDSFIRFWSPHLTRHPNMVIIKKTTTSNFIVTMRNLMWLSNTIDRWEVENRWHGLQVAQMLHMTVKMSYELWTPLTFVCHQDCMCMCIWFYFIFIFQFISKPFKITTCEEKFFSE